MVDTKFTMDIVFCEIWDLDKLFEAHRPKARLSEGLLLLQLQPNVCYLKILFFTNFQDLSLSKDISFFNYEMLTKLKKKLG